MEFQYEEHRIFLEDEHGELLAEITFPKVEDQVIIDHTFVSDQLRGQGVASKLMQAAIDTITAQNWRFTATCSYAKAWLEKHPEVLGIYKEKTS